MTPQQRREQVQRFVERTEAAILEAELMVALHAGSDVATRTHLSDKLTQLRAGLANVTTLYEKDLSDGKDNE